MRHSRSRGRTTYGHTFAFQSVTITNADAHELEQRLGHRSQRYIQRYTNPPEQVAGGY